jgi:hypothetical protein
LRLTGRQIQSHEFLCDGERFSLHVPRLKKAAVNAPHSRRFAQCEDVRQSRQRLGLRWLQHRFPALIDRPANPVARISEATPEKQTDLI